ncbi:MAG: hypothetical protein FWC64_08220 [Treponema sp.]|nr:hypothetical protein [Treponema sp.]
MLSREDFVFTIGYDGPAAVVDRQAKRKYGKLSTGELVEKGLFRAAYSSAVYSKDPQEQRLVAEAHAKLKGLSPADVSQADISALGRLFGVFLVDVKRSISI